MKKRIITWPEIIKEARILRHVLRNDFLKVYGVPRGGQPIAPLIGIPVDTPEEADIIVDDLIDSGETEKKYSKYGKPFHALFNKKLEGSTDWYVFPWETGSEQGIEANVTRIIQFAGDKPEREGLKETPRRYIKFLKEFCTPPEFKFTTFKNEGSDEMIIVKDIPFYSLCEHHLAPFFGTGAIAYIPNEKIVGLSKLPRTLDKFSRRFQNQERITKDVANFILEELNPKGVAVVLKARHLCVEMRGVEKPGTQTITSAMLGVFKDDHKCRAEFLNLINN